MKALVSSEIEAYIQAHTTAEDEVLKALNRQTHADILMPQMLSGQVQGTFLKMITQIFQPKRLLEIGTFTGYTAICFAQAMPEDGLVHTIDINEELENIIQKYIKSAGVEKKIILHIGNAIKIIPTLEEEFDMVFIDADKINYSNYYQLVMDKLRSGGIILADNVLWSGKIIDKIKDKDTKALDDFNKLVQNDVRVDNVLISIRDGIMMIRKK